jgi:hypothetical protein
MCRECLAPYGKVLTSAEPLGKKDFPGFWTASLFAFEARLRAFPRSGLGLPFTAGLWAMTTV